MGWLEARASACLQDLTSVGSSGSTRLHNTLCKHCWQLLPGLPPSSFFLARRYCVLSNPCTPAHAVAAAMLHPRMSALSSGCLACPVFANLTQRP